MTETRQTDGNRARYQGGNPYEHLHIYYFKGRIGELAGEEKENLIGNWEEDGFSFLFFSIPSNRIVEELLGRRGDLALIENYHMTYEEWLGEKLVPSRIGRFFISAPWEKLENKVSPTGKEFHITLDPGVVFGTGTHPTTRDCLSLLERMFREQSVNSVLDLGTGTGLLALASAMLGAGRTIGVDFNLLAAKTARKNVGLNFLDDRICIAQGLAEEFIHTPADLLIANIHMDIMEKIVLSEGFLEKKGFILSGLLRSQALAIERTLSKLPVTILQRRDNGVWFTFLGMCR